MIVNTDPIDHEFILGDERVQLVHEEGTEAHHAPRPGEVSVPAGETVVTTYTFPEAKGSLIFGCHLPGHYDFGMRAVSSRSVTRGADDQDPSMPLGPPSRANQRRGLTSFAGRPYRSGTNEYRGGRH